MSELKLLLLAVVGLVFCQFSMAQEEAVECDQPIRIALQTWSYNRFTFEETAKRAAALGFKYIEMYPGQTIKAGNDAKTGFTMPGSDRELIKSILKKNGLQLVQYGVVTCNTKEEWIKLFDFAKAMGIETLNSEPEFKDFDLLDSLTQAYVINIAVHNHATGNRYWDPQIVIDHIKDKGYGLGFCADNGHWMRSGLDPVEMLKKTKGRLITMHIKDMNEFNNLDAHTVPFGTGVLDTEAFLNELKSLHFNGVITIENEYDWDNPDQDIKTTLSYLREHLKPNE